MHAEIVYMSIIEGSLSFLFSAILLPLLVLGEVRRRQRQQTRGEGFPGAGRRRRNRGAEQLRWSEGITSIASNQNRASKERGLYLVSAKLKIFQAGLSRILIGLLAYNVLLSLALALSTFMVPRDFEGAYSEYAKGTKATCSFQGFLFQAGALGSITYGVVLGASYALAIKITNGTNEDCDMTRPFSIKYLEICGHLAANAGAIGGGIAMLLKDTFHPVFYGQICWADHYQSFDSNDEESRGFPRTGFAFFLCMIGILVNSTFILLLPRKAMQTPLTEHETEKLQVDQAIYRLEVGSQKVGEITKTGKMRNKPIVIDADSRCSSNDSTSKSIKRKKTEFLKKKSVLSSKKELIDITREEFTRKSTQPSSSKSKASTNDPLAFDVRQMKKKIKTDSVIKSQKDKDQQQKACTGKSLTIYLGDDDCDEEEGGGASSHSSSEPPFLLDPNELFVSKAPPRSRYGTDTDPYRFNVSRAKQDSSLSGMLNNHTNDSSLVVVDEDREYDICDSSQALLFMGVFLFCYPTFCVLNIVYRIIDSTLPYCLVLFSTILFAMQGVLISLVCSRPTMMMLKKENPEDSFGRIFFSALRQIAGDSHQNQQEAKRVSFPIPNPMDLDDDERSELHASITKQFREYKKRTSSVRLEMKDKELLEILQKEKGDEKETNEVFP